jgi:Zn-dependent protease with chaperone function
LQSSVVGLALTWYFGDINSLLVLAPTLLLETNYSRNFERRADLYAAKLLQTNQISPVRLADILEKLESSHGDGKEKNEPTSPFLTLFSTHPDTQERIQYLRNFNAP